MLREYLKLIFDWSEAWALLIPLGFLAVRKEQPRFLKPVITYLWLALFLNLFANSIADFKQYLPGWLQGNNPIYNIHSLVRFGCFAAFFFAIGPSSFTGFRKATLLLFSSFVLFNFLFLEDFFHYDHLSGNLFSTEAYLLLVFCLLYYLAQLKNEKEVIASGADFWVTTGLCLYVVINFFVFLFYVPMIEQNNDLADNMWDIHNVAYILLCFFIAKAFYVSTPTHHRA